MCFAAFAQALEVDPKHSPSLLLLSAVSLNQLIKASSGGSKEQAKALVDRALVAGWALLEASPEGAKGLPWALLSLVYANGERGRRQGMRTGGRRAHQGSAGGCLPEEGSLITVASPPCFLAADPSLPGATRKNLPWASCRQVLSKLERACLAEGRPAREANPFLELWTEAQKLQLQELSEQVRRIGETGRDG